MFETKAEGKNNVFSEVVAHRFCCGCGVCAGVCPQKSMEMRFNDHGEYNPFPIDAGCNSCGLCLKVCPFSDQGDNEDYLGKAQFGDFENIEQTPETGFFLKSCVGYSKVDGHRFHGASGGLTTWMLETLLGQGKVDEVLCVKPKHGSHPLFEFISCKNGGEVRECSRSCYYPVELSRVIRTVLEEEKRFAVVALPCVCKALRLAANHIPKLKTNMKYILGLTCGHTSSCFFSEFIYGLAGGSPEKLKGIKFRVKEPEKSSYDFKVTFSGERNKEKAKLGWSGGASNYFFNRYFVPLACDFCDDVFAECADAVLMDAWLPEYSKNWEGHSIVLLRNPALATLFEKTGAEECFLQSIPVEKVIESQKPVLYEKRTALAERLELGNKKLTRVPEKRRHLMIEEKAFLKKILVQVRWKVSRHSPVVWIEAGRDVNNFNRLFSFLFFRLLWMDRVSRAFDRPEETYKRIKKRVFKLA